MDTQINILVIDDEEVIRNACQQALTSDMFRVDVAQHGEQALNILEKEGYDLVLLDLKMPGLSGMEVLQRIKAMDQDTLIVVITGYVTIESTIAAMKEGACDFIIKPFTPDNLRTKVHEALKKKQEENEMAIHHSCLVDGEGFFF